jgi:hypothetical protein
MRLISSLLFVGALAVPAAAQDAPDRYTIEMSVFVAGARVASASTTIVDGGQADLLLTGADGQYTFTADLQPEQGDGQDGRSRLEAYLNHDGADLASPVLLIQRGSAAAMQIGSKDAQGAFIDGVEIQLRPLAE